MHHYCATSVCTREMNRSDSKNYVFVQTERSMLVIPSCSVILNEHTSEQYAPLVEVVRSVVSCKVR